MESGIAWRFPVLSSLSSNKQLENVEENALQNLQTLPLAPTVNIYIFLKTKM